MGLTLVRHTKPDVIEGTCYGHLDLLPANSFKQEADVVLGNLSKPSVLISSPLKRCSLLAAKISEHFGVPIQFDDRVREMSFGNWEGILWNDIPRDELDQWSDDFYHARPHEGESVQMLHTRVKSAITDYQSTGLSHIVVCHSGVIKAAVAKGMAMEDFSTELAFGGVIKI